MRLWSFIKRITVGENVFARNIRQLVAEKAKQQINMANGK